MQKPAASFEITVPVDASTGRDVLRVWLTYYYCRTGAEGLCKAGSVVWTVPVELADSGPSAVVSLPHRVR